MATQVITKIPYINPSGRYRPYFEIVLSNPGKSTTTNKTFALVDSGADHISVPYSIGKQLQLDPPTKDEQIKSLSGVSGSITYLERTCDIYLADLKKSEMYKFSESVWWIHPDREILDSLDKILQEFNILLELGDKSKNNSAEVQKYIEEKQLDLGLIYSQIIRFYEGEVLLGRTFFDNFDFIQFFHRDRNNEEKCFFNFQLSKLKKAQIFPLKSV